MAADTPGPELSSRELAALADALQAAVAAVYVPGTGRLYLCPNPWHLGRCDRERSFTIPEARVLAARVRSGELGPDSAASGAIVLAYGIPIPQRWP